MQHLQLCQVLMFALALIVVTLAPHQTLSAALNQALPGCKSTCGNIEIPYPFGIGYSSTPDQRPCFMEPVFSLTCDDSKLKWGNIQVLSISLPSHQMDIKFWVSNFCNKGSNTLKLTTSKSTVSRTENKFVTVGCDSYGYLDSIYDGKKYSTGCLTRCYGNELKIDDGTCSGIGCCQVDIPPRTTNISIEAFSYSNNKRMNSYISSRSNASIVSDSSCSYSFVVKHDSYKFSISHLQSFPYKELPLVLDWFIGNKSCNDVKSGDDNACRNSSYCDDKNADYGYRCICEDGYEGNPYLGCTDIDECKTGKHTCISEKNCLNTNGSYECFCPKGQSGNGTKREGCHRTDVVSKIIIGIGVGIVILLVGTTLLYSIYQKWKLISLREKYFQQNGGSLLQKELSTREQSSHIQIFPEEQLLNATKNFDESLIINDGAFATVFKGHLPDNSVVAVKKPKKIDKIQNEQFVNEVMALSQIKHRNVVKLLGCCLETEAPLMVYEFFNNGTLSDFIHSKRKVNDAILKTRLKIAAEAAGALSYLHSEASEPIIHKDVKTANILLDDTYTAKVADFGASGLVPHDQAELATMVQGNIGYLDPEYMQTSQLTEKSDVYSFGAVLTELLTGEKPYSFGRPEKKRSLANNFLSCLKEDRLYNILQDGILNEQNEKEIRNVANLAEKCLRVKGEERPSMKEVAMELEMWINTDPNLEETDYLVDEASSKIFEPGDSSCHQEYDSVGDLATLGGGR